ncbi:MAG: EF-hand domain-containing protein [Terracidiphilus sp.]|nr:EF-hand domain-containing protein [Terracidiphilus sp.]
MCVYVYMPPAGYVDTYLSSYPSEQELSFREKVRQALRQDADVAFETLSAGTGKVTPEQWSKIIAALLHSGISDAIHVYSRGGLASLSPIVKGFLDTVSTESKRIDVPLPLTTQRLFDAIDTDADGVIEFAEFVAASRATNLPFMVIAGKEPSFSANSAKPVVLELAGAIPAAL